MWQLEDFGFASIEQLFDTGVVVSAELREQLSRIAPVVLAAEQVLPVPEVFHELLRGRGLQRGWTLRVEGAASARAMTWALLGGVTTAGGWIASVDVPGVGLAAAQEVGVAIERVLVVNTPDPPAWSASIGALIGSVDVIVFGEPQHRVVPTEFRRMSSRARERGSVLVELASTTGSKRGSQLQYDLTFDVHPVGWRGIGAGYGRLQGRILEVEASGRRIGGAPRRARYELPAAAGSLRVVEPEARILPMPTPREQQVG